MSKSGLRLFWRKYKPVALLALILLAGNLTFASSAGWARAVWQILGFAGLAAIYYFSRLKTSDIGLGRKNFVSGLKYSAWIILGIFAAMLLVFAVDPGAYKDPRYHHELSTALYSSLLILPLKTVIFEELAFRGILLGLLLKRTTRSWAIGVSSLMFGLWHVSSATNMHQVSFLGHRALPSIVIVIPTVLITALAGVFFCELRLRSKSLVAPIAVHWFINGAAIVFAALSWT